MRHTVLEAVCTLFASASLTFGCSSSSPSPPNSFTEVYAKVIQPTCSNDYCHFNGVTIRYSALDMSSRVIAYWNLVDQPLVGPSCALMGRRVIPFQPDASFMYQKIAKTMPPCGSQMPAEPIELLTTGSAVFSGHPLSQDQLQLVFNWIAEGAQNN